MINNRRTSMLHCSEECGALKDICQKEHIHRNQLIEQLDRLKSQNEGLTSLTRLFLLMYYKSLASDLEITQKNKSLYPIILEKIKLAGITQIK